MAFVGDANDDEVQDVVVGAPNFESSDAKNLGLITLFHMKSNGNWEKYQIYYGQ